ncbi:MAG TPA: DNA polymerase III subunit alpha [Spirochaetia bacterium]|nr:MAG: DNA polymerase III subunit alpha [Spirochaetes bacterium GWB1_36_13]HCL57437.1 DNA polymerase III subunit alpha [Spirochaetia bacterium]
MPHSGQFVHLHVHSHYSIGDAINKVSDIYGKAKEFGMKAVALTDHGNLFGAAEFFIKSVPGVKPIIGCEMYITPFSRKEKKAAEGESKYYHLVLLAKDSEGYRNLVELVSIGYLEGFYYRPRIDFEVLQERSKGLIALSACLAGEIPRLVQAGNFQKAEERSLYYQDVFGKDNFFLEIMDNGMEKQRLVNEEILKISKKTGIPLVATNDVHYPNKGDDKAHDVFLCILEGKKVTDEKRKRYESDQFYFKSYEEMKEGIGKLSMESISNTSWVADNCSFYPELGEYKLPHYDLPEGMTPEIYLKDQCYEMLPKKINKVDEEVTKRLDFELDTINRMGFPAYFLIVQDFINYARSAGISVGPGRGSAAGSLVSYLLGITEINPLDYQLLFERFLNPGRISMPDIDIDFDDFGRGRVIDYVKNKYGEEKVAQIITYNTLKAKAVIKDVGRVLDIPLNEVNAINKMVTESTLEKSIKENTELKTKIESEKRFQELWHYGLRLEGLIRNSSIHAAGVVIGKERLTSAIPLYRDSKTEAIITQFDGKYLEEFGLMKMDFLGIKNLRIMAKTLELIQKRQGKTIETSSFPLNDKKVYKIFQEGRTIGIFQCESPGIRELMKKITPSSIEDVIALIALYRPGPLNSGMADDFVKRKKNPALIKYPHKDLKEVLQDTYGVIVYQEQVMLISRIIAGFELKDADNLRKAMGKKDKEKMAKMKEQFVSGAVSKGHKNDFAETLFEQMEKFAEYGFNKSHSTAYAFIAYQNAYLKTYYPIEYITATLNAEKDGKIEDLMKYLKEAREMEIDIKPPHVNQSQMDFSIEDEKSIRFGLSAVKNVGEANVSELLEERETNGTFQSLTDLISRTSINKRVLETLTLAGALDGLIPNRASVISGMEDITRFSSMKKKDRDSGMLDLFDMGGDSQAKEEEFHLSVVAEYKENQILKMEKANLGLYVTGHPLAKYEEKIKAYTTKSSRDLKEIQEAMQNEDNTGFEIPESIQIAGIVIRHEIKMTKKNEPMMIGYLEDLEAEIKVVFFPKVYQSILSRFSEDIPLLVKGKVDFDSQELQLRAESVEFLDDLPDIIKTKILNIRLDEKNIRQDNIDYLKKIFQGHLGTCPIVFHLYDLVEHKKVNIKAGKEFNITITDTILEKIRKISCVEDLWVNGS